MPPKILNLIYSIFFITSAFSQTGRFRHFTNQEGLSSYNANHILQDKFGFIWITTQEGINRFDGKSFTVIKKRTPDDAKSLNATYVRDCKQDKAGNLWTASEYGGVDVINPQTLQVVQRLNEKTHKQKGFISNWVRALSWSGNNKLWIGTYYGINIYTPASGDIKAIRQNPLSSSSDLNVNFIGADSSGHVWAGVENQGVIIFNAITGDAEYMLHKKDLGFSENDFFNLNDISFSIKDNSAYLCTNKGIRHYAFEQKKIIQLDDIGFPGELNNEEISCIEKDNSGNFWIGSKSGIFICSPDKKIISRFTHNPENQGSILNNVINDIFIDSFNNIWVSTSKGISLYVQGEYDFTVINKSVSNNLLLNHTYSITAFTGNSLLVSDESGLFHIEPETNTIKLILSEQDYGIIDAVYVVKPGEIIASGQKKTVYVKIQNNKVVVLPLSQVFKELSVIENNYFSTIFPVGDSVLLFGSMDETGLHIWNRKNKTVKNFTTANGLADNYVQNIRYDSKGNIWLLSDLCLTRFDINAEKFYHSHPNPGEKGKLNSFFLMDLLDDGKTTWVTSYGGGINYTETGKTDFAALSEENGINSNSTYNIIRENDSIFWVSSNNGLARVNNKSKKIKSFFAVNGLQSNSFENRSACKLGNDIFFGGIDGITRIRRSAEGNIIYNGVFPVHISKIEYYEKGIKKDTTDILLNQIVFGNNTNYIIFNISALSFQHTGMLSYEYRVNELSNEWLSAKEERIVFAGLPKGVYHFQVRCKSDTDNWNYSRQVIFEVLPKWYQTWWFKILVVLFISGVVYAVYRNRINQLKKEEKIRNQLASDLHDELGSTLNSVKIFTNLAMMEKDNSSYLVKIKDAIQSSVTGLRDIIWILDDKRDTVEHLFIRVDQFAKPVCEAAGLNYKSSADENLLNTKLDKEEKRNLYMIIRESVNNAIKYADGKTIRVIASENNGRLTINISDDGKGFDITQSSNGYGLRNIRQRAKDAGYNATINSAPNEGTIILLEKN